MLNRSSGPAGSLSTTAITRFILTAVPISYAAAYTHPSPR